MNWFILFVGIVVICFVVALLLGLVGGGMGRPTSSLSHEPLPEGEIDDADFDELVFDVTARGYRMSQVDGVVDRLRRALREKDEEIAVLRGEAGVARPVERVEPGEQVAPAQPEPEPEPDPGPEPEPELQRTSEPTEPAEPA
ncbi:cell division protein DivIVA [Intrasporangium oryzae NRRL B-24470]|uniref:Cell division protein DivIVA n=1 Tax=Intrasporangium oryzae NRRL B-24470 TaxID=1386089 RepID=W9G8E9_9MICO|nr:hypothetical protein [Intrasporangium oryzae]EWT01088.1 cell division protein DivIVA [Intrasporangium oryzae NRRL B-24470]